MKNSLLETMARGDIAYGLLLRQARTVDIALAAASCNLDWLFLDLEHNTMDLGTAVQISVTAQAVGLAPIIRVPKGDYGLACRLLDGGATGAIMPNIRNSAEAAEFARACRYWPDGGRSFAGTSPHTGFRPMKTGEALIEIEEIIALFATIESREGAANMDEILGTRGINGIFLGLQDLSIDLGVPGQTNHADVVEVIERGITLALRHGKFIGIAGIIDAGELRARLDLGCHFAIVGNDLNLLRDGIAGRLRQLAGPPQD